MRKRRGKQRDRWARMGRAYQVRGAFCDGACRQLVPPVNGRTHDVNRSCEIYSLVWNLLLYKVFLLFSTTERTQKSLIS